MAMNAGIERKYLIMKSISKAQWSRAGQRALALRGKQEMEGKGQEKEAHAAMG